MEELWMSPGRAMEFDWKSPGRALEDVLFAWKSYFWTYVLQYPLRPNFSLSKFYYPRSERPQHPRPAHPRRWASRSRI